MKTKQLIKDFIKKVKLNAKILEKVLEKKTKNTIRVIAIRSQDRKIVKERENH